MENKTKYCMYRLRRDVVGNVITEATSKDWVLMRLEEALCVRSRPARRLTNK